jgi:hypothetical protein
MPQCDQDVRGAAAAAVVICGGLATHGGVAKRLHAELCATALAAERYESLRRMSWMPR